jgi:hypothetical protein
MSVKTPLQSSRALLDGGPTNASMERNASVIFGSDCYIMNDVTRYEKVLLIKEGYSPCLSCYLPVPVFTVDNGINYQPVNFMSKDHPLIGSKFLQYLMASSTVPPI